MPGGQVCRLSLGVKVHSTVAPRIGQSGTVRPPPAVNQCSLKAIRKKKWEGGREGGRETGREGESM